MVGFLRSHNAEEEFSESKIQPASKQGKSSDLPFDQSLFDFEENSLSLADSFIDYNYNNDWVDQRSELHSMESSVTLNATEQHSLPKSQEPRSTGVEVTGSLDKISEQVQYSEGTENTASSSYLEAKRSGDEICNKGANLDCCEEAKVKEEVVVNFGDEKVDELGCLIEKEMGKVNINGASSVNEEAEVMNIENDVLGITEEGYFDDLKSKGGEDSEKFLDVDSGNEKGVASHVVGIGKDESCTESETESSSSSSSSASSSSDDDEEEEEEEEEEEVHSNRRDLEIEEGEILACNADDMVAWSDDDGVEGTGPKGPIRSKNELQELPFVPAVNVTIQPHHQTLPVGNISSIIGAQVIVEGVEKHNPLNEGSILWITESRSPLGIVDEIFGPVKNPYYIVRYNSEDDVPVGIQQGTLISFVQEFAHHVLNDKNIYKKGYDASGENDEELSEEAEFSDDEKEAEYKRSMKMKKRGGTTEQKSGNRTMEKKNVRNNQKQNEAFARQGPVDKSQPQGSGNGRWSGPALPQSPQIHGFGTPSSGPGTNGVPCQQQQQPQGTIFPSFPMIGTPSSGPGTNGVPCQQQQPQGTGFPSFPMIGTPSSGPGTNGVPCQQQQPPQGTGFPSFPMIGTPSSGPGTNGVPCQQQQPQGTGFPSFPMIGTPSSGPGTNGMPCQQQQPQGTGFPSFPMMQPSMMPFPGVFPAMNMQWAAQQSPMFNMPMANQVNAGPMFPSNFMPGGQPSFGMGQGMMFNQPSLGLHGQSNSLPMNSGQQVFPQSGSFNDSRPPPPSGTQESSWNNSHFRGGRQANRRGGGGRFRGRRGGR